MTKTLFLGFGNPLLSDDGIGTKVVLHLKDVLAENNFDFEWEYTCNMDVINLINGYDNLVLIDGKISSGSDPGEICYFDIDNYTGATHLDNYHDVSFRNLIQLGQKIGIKTPENIKIIAIEIAEDKTFSQELSALLQDRWDDIIKEVIKFTEKFTDKILI